MADEGRKKAERAVADLLSTKANKPHLVPALVGAYINGQKTLVVDGRPDYLWVRLHGNTSEPIKAFNGETGVGPHWDLPILVYRDEVDTNIWKVYGRDNRVYQTWTTPGGQPISYLPKHGYTHSFGGSGSIGNDIAWIYKRQWMPLLPRPNATGTMAIYVEPGFYFCGDQYHYWPGSGTQDFTGNKPTGAFNGRFVTTYLDCASETLAYLNGPELNVYAPPFDPGDHIAVPPVGAGVPLAAVWIVTGTTDIGWFEIYDLRATEHVQPTGTSNLLVLDEGLLLGAATHMDFQGAGVTITQSGTFSNVNIPGGGGGGGPIPPADQNVTIREDGIFQVTGTLDFTDDIEVTVSGSRARVSVVIPPPPILLPNVDQFVTVREDGVFQVTGTLDFTDDIEVTVSGSRARVSVVVPPPPILLSNVDQFVTIMEDGQFIVTGTLDFTDDIEVSVSGSRARVSVVIPPPPILLTNADQFVTVRREGGFQVTGTVDFTGNIDVSVSGTRARVNVTIPAPPLLLTNVDQFVTVRREGQFVVTGTLDFVTPFSASASGSSARIGLDAAAIDHGALSGLADDDHGHYLRGLEAYKDADQEITSTTLADDSELSLMLGTGSKYGFEFRLFVLNDGVAEGYKVALGGSVGFSDLKAQVLIYDDTLNALAAFARLTATGTSVGGGLGIGNNYAEVKGSIRTTSSGTFVLQFAQNAAGASAGVHNEIGSILVVTQLE